MPNEGTVEEFPWPSRNNPNGTCRVSVRRGQGGEMKVYILPVEDDGNEMKSCGVVFCRDELPNLISALTAAMKTVDSP